VRSPKRMDSYKKSSDIKADNFEDFLDEQVKLAQAQGDNLGGDDEDGEGWEGGGGDDDDDDDLNALEADKDKGDGADNDVDDDDDEDDDGWEETEEEELTRLLSQADTLSPDESIRVKELMIIEAADAEIQDMVTQGKELSGDQQERLRRIMERKVRREAVTKRRAKRKEKKQKQKKDEKSAGVSEEKSDGDGGGGIKGTKRDEMEDDTGMMKGRSVSTKTRGEYEDEDWDSLKKGEENGIDEDETVTAQAAQDLAFMKKASEKDKERARQVSNALADAETDQSGEGAEAKRSEEKAKLRAAKEAAAFKVETAEEKIASETFAHFSSLQQEEQKLLASGGDGLFGADGAAVAGAVTTAASGIVVGTNVLVQMLSRCGFNVRYSFVSFILNIRRCNR
jgi:hypothetical protein